MTRLTVLKQRLPRFNLSVAKGLPVHKGTDSLYSSPEFRRWRAGVLKRARSRCEWVMQDGSLCGVTNTRMYADHVVEVRDGGALFDPSNGQCLCASHHTIKTNLVKRARSAWKPSG